MTDTVKEVRERFEAWAGREPYDKDLDRFKDNGAWPGHYKDYDVQLAWEAWVESHRYFEDIAP